MEIKEEIKLKIALKYLHDCLQNDASSEQIEFLKQLGFDITSLKDGRKSDLSKIRDKLLDQVKFSK